MCIGSGQTAAYALKRSALYRTEISTIRWTYGFNAERTKSAKLRDLLALEPVRLRRVDEDSLDTWNVTMIFNWIK